MNPALNALFAKKRRDKIFLYFQKPFKKMKRGSAKSMSAFQNVLEFVDKNYLYAGNMSEVVSRMFGIAEVTIEKYSRSILQMKFFDYVACKKIDHAAEMFVNHEKKWELIVVLDIVGWVNFASYDSFASCFYSRYGYTWCRWANLGKGFDDEQDGIQQGFIRAWAEKYHKKLMEKNRAHKTTWREIWDLPDEEKRCYRLSDRFEDRIRIHTLGDWPRRGVDAASKKNLESHISDG